jgi:hypothetical protein
MNPLLSESVVRRAYERDAQAATSKFGGEFHSDVMGFLDVALVDAAVDKDIMVRPPRKGVDYRAACDPSGGAHDSFAFAVAHDDGDLAVLDCMVEIRPPFNPTSATEQIAETLKSYGLSSWSATSMRRGGSSMPSPRPR